MSREAGAIQWAVEAASNPVQQTSGGEARQDNPWRTDGVQIDGAQQPLLACQIEDALGVSVGGHDRQMFRLFFQYSI
ncbi:MAG: hypothetical protein BGO72_01065 [Burkholderiales bacterium 70-64]|nr:MAG: hypothetical protein BGO72_01065 [Burkholderiales bacterium 70-64]